MSGTMDDDGQACSSVACALKLMFSLDCLGATSAANFRWKRERSIKMAKQVERRSSRGITGAHHQRKAPLMMMKPELWVQSTRGSLVQRRHVFCCCYLPWPQRIYWLCVWKTENDKAKDKRCRTQVVWWQTDGLKVRASVDNRMVTSRVDPSYCGRTRQCKRYYRTSQKVRPY